MDSFIQAFVRGPWALLGTIVLIPSIVLFICATRNAVRNHRRPAPKIGQRQRPSSGQRQESRSKTPAGGHMGNGDGTAAAGGA